MPNDLSIDTPITIVLEDDDGETSQIELSDGGIEINLDPKSTVAADDDGDWGENLALKINPGELLIIGADLCEAIEADDKSRTEWLETRAAGIEMLGFKMEKPKSEPGSEGMSTVRSPILSEAVIRFQSNASAELYPAEGPAKVRDDSAPQPPPDPDAPPPMGHNGGPDMTSSDLAEALERGLNHYLTVVDKGYRPDSVRMLFWVGFGGCAFKKVYNDPIRRMPISRTVDAADLIVSDNANDIDDCGRITHKITMRPSTLKRMKIAGVYRDVGGITSPNYEPDPVAAAKSEVQGFAPKPDRQEDQPFTIYECYCELDIKGYEHKDKNGKITGLQLPYRVTIEKDSREVLEIRRNWREDDENCIAKKIFVKFGFVPAMGFYDIGLLHILGNATKALTGAWRLMLDAGMFGSFPGFLYSEAAGRQLTNEFRIPPGGGQKIQTGGRPITEVVMPLPYKDVGNGLMTLAKAIEESAQRVGGTAELQVAESRQDAPVGTTLAMIEQATKMIAAVHVNLHAAQSEELQLLKECFKEDPEAFWRQAKGSAKQWEIDEFLDALDNCDIVPAADPNTPSHMHRIMKALAIKQLQQAAPELYDGKKVDARIMRMIGIADPYDLFAAPQPPADPSQNPEAMEKMAELALKQRELDQKDQDLKFQQDSKMADLQQQNQATAMSEHTKQQTAMTESADRAADRQSAQQLEQGKEKTEQIKLVGEMAQSGMIDPHLALAAATGTPVPPQMLHAAVHPPQPHGGFAQAAPKPAPPGLVPAKPGSL